jgi:site-specific DNA-methyltransferase (adenine-specific)
MDDVVTLYHGRCEDIMGQLVPEAYSMVLADLPYATTRNSWDRPIDPKLLWWHYNQLVPDNGAVLLFGSGLFSARMICSNEDAFRYSLVWDKEAVTGFLNAKRQPLRAHEDLLVFYRAQPYYDPQMVETGRRSHSRGKRVDRTINHYGQFTNTPVPEDQEGQHPRSILSFARPKPSVHPTQKPLALCEWAIRSFAPEGTTVLDNVAGSGSTLLAAARAGRRAVGIEVREDYCELAADRLAARDKMEDPAWIKHWSKRQKETT